MDYRTPDKQSEIDELKSKINILESEKNTLKDELDKYKKKNEWSVFCSDRCKKCLYNHGGDIFKHKVKYVCETKDTPDHFTFRCKKCKAFYKMKTAEG